MSHLVRMGENGEVVYDGLLTSKEIIPFDEILETLKNEIPEIEMELKETYGASVKYKYYLGKILGGLLKRYKVASDQRRIFWDEIKNFATKEERKRADGTNSKTRSFYEQCYILSEIDYEAVEKLSWRQWQDLLDRTVNREDERIYKWIKEQKKKIREDDWREFEKALNLLLKDKDTSVFNEEELFELYDAILQMCVNWREMFNLFAKANPKSAKIKTKSKRSKKYYVFCYNLKREQKKMINDDMCKEAFRKAMQLS